MKRAVQVIFILWVISTLPLAAAFDQYLPSIEQKEQYDLGLALIDAFKNDDANVLFSKLISDLEINQALKTSFGLSVRYRQADVLEKDHQNELAITILLSIVKDATQLEEWKYLSLAHISLARLHEKIGRGEQCYTNLQQAKQFINQYKLDSITPRLFNRISSYHRIYENKDSAIFYAQKALVTSSAFDRPLESATANLLLGMLLSKSEYSKAVEHLSNAGEIYKNNGDFSGYGAIQANLSKLHFFNGQKKVALIHNDSALLAAEKAKTFGNEKTWLFYTNYKTRAKILQSIHQYDSAWHYLNKGYEMELASIGEDNHQKVIEIDARYKDEQKAARIEEQKRELQSSKERNLWSFGVMMLLVSFAGILAYYYFKLRAANKKTIEQASINKKANKELSKSLNEQIILQGEIHHRVKNNLQVIIGLLDLHRDEIEDLAAKDSLDTLSDRIYSIAAIHEILYQIKGTERINLSEYTEHLCKHLKGLQRADRQPIFQFDMVPYYFNLETLMPIGIVLNELITNSIKHAKIETQRLEIKIKLKETGKGFTLIYKDNGPGFSAGKIADRQGGLGNYLLKSMSRQLDGKLSTSNDHGAVCTVYFEEKNKAKSYA